MTMRLKRALVGALAATGTNMSDDGVALILKRLEQEDEDEAVAALLRAAEECRHPIRLADVLDRVRSRHTMDADAAWEMAIRLEVWDERKTLVIPWAVFAAFPFAVWATGDRIAARMAFRAAYPDCVAEQNQRREPIHVSLGHDREGRAPALREAVDQGLITRERAVLHLPGVYSIQPDALATNVRARMLELHGEVVG